VALLVGASFTYRQLQTNRRQLEVVQQGQVTERFTRAIDQLGHESLDVRLGGIYALERIATDSPQDRATIAEVLTAFIRGHAPRRATPSGHNGNDVVVEDVPSLRMRAADVQAALTVLGRRSQPIGSAQRLDLRTSDLRGADLSDAQFQGVYLSGALLDLAFLRNADLKEAGLFQAELKEADLRNAQLQMADLARANLQGARLGYANLRKARLSEAQLQRADLSCATELRGSW
jgi:uncharacterized protein YjbI with pentapeptide repeats